MHEKIRLIDSNFPIEKIFKIHSITIVIRSLIEKDCNEDFAGVVNCTKGYMWNPSACECQCDKWCKQGQYLDHKNCVCKNKLIGRVIEECTSVINETMINNNKDNITNNTHLILFIVFLIRFIAFLIGFIYYCRRSNFDRKKLKDFIYPKTSIY